MKFKRFEKLSYKTRFVDTLISTAFRHVAKRAVYSLDGYISNITKETKLLTIRCTSCFKLNSYSFNNSSYSCIHCKR